MGGRQKTSSIDRAKISRAATTVRSSPVTLSRSQRALAQKSVVQQGSKDAALLPHKPLSKKRARSHNVTGMNVGSSAGPNCNPTHAVQLSCCWETGQDDQVTVSFVDSGDKLGVYFASCLWNYLLRYCWR